MRKSTAIILGNLCWAGMIAFLVHFHWYSLAAFLLAYGLVSEIRNDGDDNA